MKNSTLATKLMLAAIFLTVLIYFGVNLAAYFTDPYTTTVAYAYTGEEAVTVSGYVARSEEVLAGGGELVYSARREGERVGAGGGPGGGGLHPKDVPRPGFGQSGEGAHRPRRGLVDGLVFEIGRAHV